MLSQQLKQYFKNYNNNRIYKINLNNTKINL